MVVPDLLLRLLLWVEVDVIVLRGAKEARPRLGLCAHVREASACKNDVEARVAEGENPFVTETKQMHRHKMFLGVAFLIVEP